MSTGDAPGSVCPLCLLCSRRTQFGARVRWRLASGRRRSRWCIVVRELFRERGIRQLARPRLWLHPAEPDVRDRRTHFMARFYDRAVQRVPP